MGFGAATVYEYVALVQTVYDGDSVRVDIDLGFRIWTKMVELRLLGINTPEINSPDPALRAKAIVARDALREQILGKTVLLRTEKDHQEKFGRFLATIFVGQSDGSLLNVNQWLLDQGYAVPYLV